MVASDRGATSIEYAIMVTMIAMAIIVAVATLGSALGEDFDCAEYAIEYAPGGC